MSSHTEPLTKLDTISDEELVALSNSWRETPQEEIHEMVQACAENDSTRFNTAFNTWLAHGFDIHELEPVLQEAVVRNNVEVVSTLAENGYLGIGSVAHVAIESRSKDVLEFMLKSGWDINNAPQTYPAVLSLAVKDEEMLTWLIDHGADPNQQCAIDLTPMSIAVKEAPISTIKLLLDRGATVNKGQLLYYAVERQSDVIEVLSILLERAAHLNARWYDDHPYSASMFFYLARGTPLHKAVTAGKYSVVQYLLGHGADPAIKDSKGSTPLSSAVQLGREDIVALLEGAQ
ncbi:putative hspc200 [Aspergillus heterothallicus]